MSEPTYRVAIVGCGGWGTSRANDVRDLGHEVVAGAEVDDDTRERFAREFDADPYEDYADLPYGDLDAVIVGTPNAFHAPAAVEALERDTDVYVAKPMADGLDAAEDMLDAEAASAAHGMVGFNSRFTAAAALITAYRDDGYFGDITHVEADSIRRRGIPGVGSWFTNRELSGGGALIDIGVHAIDRVCYYLGFPEVAEVSGTTRSEFGGREDYADPRGFAGHWDEAYDTFDVDDSATALVRFADGTTVSLEVAWASNRERAFGTVIRGTEGGATVRRGEPGVTLHGTGTDGVDHFVDTTVEGEREPDNHAAALSMFFDALAADAPPEHCTFEEAIVSQRIMDAIYRSSEAGRAVQLA